jgi:hypothetical protein
MTTTDNLKSPHPENSNTIKDKNVDKDGFDEKRRLWFILSAMVWMGIAAVMLLCIKQLTTTGNKSLIWFLSDCGTSLLIAGACFGLGGLMGFLFGVPKVLQNTALLPDELKGRDSIILHNDNLVQISDWFTKIIVGVGLTQLYKIPGAVESLGEKMSHNFSGDVEVGRNAAIGIVLYFSVVGFLAVYIWTRIYFVGLLFRADNELREELKKTQEDNKLKEKELQSATEETKRKEEDVSSLMHTVSPMLSNLKTKYEEYKANPNKADDPQKGKWGGQTENNGRIIKAVVRETTYSTELFNIMLEVSSTDATKPLTGEVFFHLHPTFPKDIGKVTAEKGVAVLNLTAYGAFTVGVECDNGSTKLEIDLAQLSDAPALFKQR